MKRELFAMVSAISLLLCAATAVLWGRSYWRIDNIGVVRFGLDRPGDHGDISDIYSISSARGGIRFDFTETDDRNDGVAPTGTHVSIGSMPATSGAVPLALNQSGIQRFNVAGFVSGTEHFAGSHADGDFTFLVVPHWLFVGITAIGSIPILLWLKRGRIPKHVCPRCSYDLTGNISGVCPECGTAIMGTVGA